MLSSLNRKQRLTLKQLGYSEGQIEQTLTLMGGEQFDFNTLVENLRCNKCNPKLLSSGWSPSISVLKELNDEGYIDYLVELLIPVYVYEVRNGVINPRDVNAFFKSWAKNRMGMPQKPSEIEKWHPGHQLRQWKREISLTDYHFNHHLALYKEYCEAQQNAYKRINHDQAFVAFFRSFAR